MKGGTVKSPKIFENEKKSGRETMKLKKGDLEALKEIPRAVGRISRDGTNLETSPERLSLATRSYRLTLSLESRAEPGNPRDEYVLQLLSRRNHRDSRPPYLQQIQGPKETPLGSRPPHKRQLSLGPGEGSNLNYVTIVVDEQDNIPESTTRESELQRQLDGLKSQEGSNLNYVTIVVDEQDNIPESTTRESELQRQLNGLKSQVTDLHKAREAIENPELSSENQALNTTNNKKRRFRTQVRSIPSFDTPNSVGDAARHPSSEAGASGEKAGGMQIHETISSDSEPDSEKETSREVAEMKSSMTAYLEQVFSQKLDAMQSLVERLPGVAPPIRKSNPGSYADSPLRMKLP
ncbi:hypothetical protein DY000_02007607 [Brassica cretica]|uniref:Uncharacterized protein n=1 Tax=Brassica cretica TaxID=69181 RepID=A0ABQ7CIT1_BRACR|nr:hypothetical protein DY000_02007607 [Brassica cretica]